jgi:hypothetical protein
MPPAELWTTRTRLIARIPRVRLAGSDGIRLALEGSTPLRKEQHPPETRSTPRETGRTWSPALSFLVTSGARPGRDTARGECAQQDSVRDRLGVVAVSDDAGTPCSVFVYWPVYWVTGEHDAQYVVEIPVDNPL